MAVLTLKSDEYKAFPPICKQYASYVTIIKGNSEKTVCEYLQDLRTFFRFILARRDDLDTDPESLETISISEISIDDVISIKERDILEFLMYTSAQRKNSGTTRMRKISSLRSFFGYLYKKQHLITEDPTANIDSPKKGSSLPKYLTVDEAVLLLDTIRGDKASATVARDYAIVCLFLNTGMRLSELVGLDLESFDSQITQVKVRGKGNKERMIYINNAAREAVENYLRVRLDPKHVRTSEHALFLSSREQRISNKTVQWIVYKYLKLAGLKTKGMSVHKLRHTAATLMYQTGKVDIRVLKDILGHEQLNTTQIYTHIAERNLEEAIENNPLSSITLKQK